MDQLFKTKEEVAEFVALTINGIDQKKATNEATQKALKDAEIAQAAEKAALAKVLSDLSTGMTALTADVTALKTATAPAQAIAGEGDGEILDAEKQRKTVDTKKEKTSVFKGIFLRRGTEPA